MVSQGFFPASEWVSARRQPLLVPRCGSCGLLHNCRSPKMPVAGHGKLKILVIGEAPGQTEDRLGKPFVGYSGELLRRSLALAGVDLDKDCWTTNSLICHPKDPDGSNRTPSDKEISYCRPNIIRTIKELEPEVVIPLGGSAVKSLVGWLWKEDVGQVGRWVGWQIPSQRINAWVCPTWHPSAVLRNERGQQDEVMAMLFRRHLAAACGLEGRPWREVPDYGSRIRVITNVQEAVEYMDHFLVDVEITKAPVAFDYETDRLKPDSSDRQIVCCSLSDGGTAFAYPWHGEAIKATQEFLRSDVPKIASNQKFEQRWTKQVFGHGVRNWAFDTMLASHVLDNRPGITSIKFQAFVQLGVDSWDDAVKPFFKANGSNEANRIREVGLPQLLRYCAMDSLMEWHVAHRQAKQLGIKL